MKPELFFKKATGFIFHSLNIEESLTAFPTFLKTVMPVDHIFLEQWESDFRSMKTYLVASEKELVTGEILTPLSNSAKANIEERYFTEGTHKVSIWHDPFTDSVAGEMLAFHKIESNSLIVLTLGNRSDPVGALVVSSIRDRYTEEQAELIGLLQDPLQIALKNSLKHQEVIALKNMFDRDNRFLKEELREQSVKEMIGSRLGLKQVTEHIARVAPLPSPVLLMGETGVGKDVAASVIHHQSPRKHKPFISVNCGAIPKNLIDSELFGHEKGAFTGALKQRKGRFERANFGTIFLDEIGELSLDAQIRLLHVLQNKSIERVGGSNIIELDTRIIAATNRDLELMVQEGTFREDLWFRLNVFPIQIPPLRDRRLDIPALFHHFLTQKMQVLRIPGIPRLGNGVMDRLMEYDWPGNVRELQNVIERELILHPNDPLTFSDLVPGRSVEQQTATDLLFDDIVPLDEANRQYINRVLNHTKGKISGPGGAAEILDVNANTLRNRMSRLGMKFGTKSRLPVV